MHAEIESNPIYKSLTEEQKREYTDKFDRHTKEIEMNPDDDNGYRNRGHVYFDIGEKEKAIADLNMAVKLNPSYQNIYERGHMFGSIGKHDKALADFNKLVEMDPNDFNSYYSRGYEYLENNIFHKAILDFNQLVKLHPQDSLAYNSRGYAYGCAGQYIKSIADFNSAIDLGDPYSYVERAEIYAKLGKKQKTITDYKEFLRLSQDPEMVQQVKQKLDKLINK